MPKRIPPLSDIQIIRAKHGEIGSGSGGQQTRSTETPDGNEFIQDMAMLGANREHARVTLFHRLTKEDRNAALRITVIYALVSGLWILLSDNLLGLLVRDPDVLVRYSVAKGLAFIAVTVSLLYLLISRYMRQSREAEEALKRLNEVLEVRIADRTRDLDKQNKELLLTYHELEEQTARRIMAVEELRQRDQIMIQQNRLAAVGEMLSNISHHWRQPLNRLGLMVQEIGMCFVPVSCNKGLLDAKIAAAMKVLRQLSVTIDDFRDFSTPDKEKSLFEVKEAVSRTLSFIQESFREQGIVIEASYSDEPMINGYPHEFRQVLLNILMNARDALLERGVPGARITVRSGVENGRAVVAITDNAGGVKNEIIDKIFDAYFTTKELGKGSGVGLFMSKYLIEKNMGGRLSVHNVKGGAEFSIEV